MTSAHIPDARRERHERGKGPQPGRGAVEPARLTVTGTMPSETIVARARPFGGALGWSSRTVIARGNDPERKMSFELSLYNG